MKEASSLPYTTMFDGNSPKYHCCCGCCHAKTGVQIIGILEAIVLGFQSVRLLAGLAMLGDRGMLNGYTMGIFLLPTLILAGQVAILVFLFKGLRQERASYLLPHMILHAISMVMVGIGLVVVIVLFAIFGDDMAKSFGSYKEEWDPGMGAMVPELHKNPGAVVGLAIGAVALVLGCLALYVWLFYVQLQCYRYFKDKKEHDQSMGGTMVVVASPQLHSQDDEKPPSYTEKE